MQGVAVGFHGSLAQAQGGSAGDLAHAEISAPRRFESLDRVKLRERFPSERHDQQERAHHPVLFYRQEKKPEKALFLVPIDEFRRHSASSAPTP